MYSLLKNYVQNFFKGKPRSKVKDAQNVVEQLLFDVRKAELRALKFKDEFDTIARYCAVTARELQELLDELKNQPPDSSNS